MVCLLSHLSVKSLLPEIHLGMQLPIVLKYSRKNFSTPACKSREDSRSQVPGWVDSVARVEAHRQANDQHHEAHSECL